MKGTFGQVLKQLRRDRNISQRDLAEKVQVDFSYISKIENDRLPPPSADTIVKICDVLKVPSENLLAFTGKISSEVKDEVLSSPDALRFLNEAREMKLSANEWNALISKMKKLR